MVSIGVRPPRIPNYNPQRSPGVQTEEEEEEEEVASRGDYDWFNHEDDEWEGSLPPFSSHGGSETGTNPDLGRKRLSFTGMDNLPSARLDLQHLNYVVRDHSRRRIWDKKKIAIKLPETRILEDINLSFSPGQLVGLMGPSGSGKTTLLRVLHGSRRYIKNVQGTVLVNGTPVRNIHGAFRKMCSLVPQEDVLLPNFTVFETLMFAAQLRLAQSDSYDVKCQAVNAVITELGLEECRHVIVGSVESLGLSGGQRRRVSIGLELLTDPSVLLLDEPSSGLDSKTAEDLCNLLQALAGPDHRCVICSIHQPSYQIFMTVFDRFVFLAKGRVCYDGPPALISGFFAALHFEAPSYENPVDYYMRILQDESHIVLEGWLTCNSKTTTMNKKVNSNNVTHHHPTAAAKLQSPRRETSIEIVEQQEQQQGGGGSAGAGAIHGGLRSSSIMSLASYASFLTSSAVEPPALDQQAQWLDKADLMEPSLFHQFIILSKRMLMDTCKNRNKLLLGLGLEIFTGLVVGLVWFQQHIYEQRSIFPILGLYSMLTTIAIFDSFVNLVLTFPLTRSLHLREYHNGYYHLLPYFFASMVSSFTMSSIYLTSDAVIVYFLVGIEFTWSRFFNYLLFMWIGGFIGAIIGFILGCMTSDIQRMQQVVVPCLLPMLIFSGYMIPLERMPVYFKWIYFASFYQYLYSGLIINHFRGLTFRDCTDKLCMKTGEQVLEVMNLSSHTLGRCLWVMVGILGLGLCLGYAALRYNSH